MPKIHPTAWVAPGAFVRGDVTIDEQANIWYNAVLRGDQESICLLYTSRQRKLRPASLGSQFFGRLRKEMLSLCTMLRR